MLIRRQDLFGLLFYYLGYSRITNLVLRFQRKSIARFVCFHDIPPGTTGSFRTNLEFLKRSTNVVSLDDFFSNRVIFKKINTVITFDDGYKSWVTDAIPILQELGLPATFFFSSGFVGLSKNDESQFIRSRLFKKLAPRKITGGLSFEDVRSIIEAGFTVGGHTMNHSVLDELSGIDQLKYEIIEDKIKVENITGRKIDYFSYPCGVCRNQDMDITEVLREAGYKGAVTTLIGFNTLKTNPFFLRRENTNASMPASVFRSRVYGNYDAVYYLKQRIRMVFTNGVHST